MQHMEHGAPGAQAAAATEASRQTQAIIDTLTAFLQHERSCCCPAVLLQCLLLPLLLASICSCGPVHTHLPAERHVGAGHGAVVVAQPSHGVVPALSERVVGAQADGCSHAAQPAHQLVGTHQLLHLQDTAAPGTLSTIQHEHRPVVKHKTLFELAGSTMQPSRGHELHSSQHKNSVAAELSAPVLPPAPG